MQRVKIVGAGQLGEDVELRQRHAELGAQLTADLG